MNSGGVYSSTSGWLSPPAACVCDSTRARIAVPRVATTAGHLMCRQVSCGRRHSLRCVPQLSAVFAGGVARRHSLSQPEVCATALSSRLACRRRLEQRSAAGAQTRRWLVIADYKSAAITACHLPSARGSCCPNSTSPIISGSATWAGIPRLTFGPDPSYSNYNKQQL
jgi:hypothetical protein